MQKIMISAILLVVINSLSGTQVYSATPVIDSASVTIKDKKTLRINGSNMIDLNAANWLNNPTQASFEGDADFISGKANQDGWIWNPDGCNADKNAEYANDIKLIGNKAAFLLNDCCACPASTQSCCGNRILTYNLDGLKEGYVAGYFRYSGQFPNGYLKFMIGQSDGGNWYFQPWSWSDNRISGYLLRDQNTYTEVRPPKNIGLNEWHHFELHLKFSTPKIFEAWIDGELIGTITPQGSLIKWDEIGIPNIAGMNSPNWIGLHMDMIAYSKTRIYPASKIEISNSSTYGQGTVKWQEPAYLSDNSSEVILDLSGLGNGPYYLWITNNKQERSKAFVLSVGSDENLSVPTGLKVIVP